jgi:hypothetical protein
MPRVKNKNDGPDPTRGNKEKKKQQWKERNKKKCRSPVGFPLIFLTFKTLGRKKETKKKKIGRWMQLLLSSDAKKLKHGETCAFLRN